MSFKKNKFKVMKQAITKELAQFCHTYFLNKRNVARFLFDHKYISPYTEYFGVWNDHQVPNTYSHYSDLVMETLLQGLHSKMQKETGYKLQPAYSYARIYKDGDVLHRHKDRYSCEISTTLNLGGDKWPIFLDPTGKEKQAGVKVELEQGDMLVYKGCDLEHWRETFKGKDCTQVFLHYNDTKKKASKQNLYDQRPFLGLPAYYKGFKIPKK